MASTFAVLRQTPEDVARGFTIATEDLEEAARDASCDPAVVVAPVMPVSLTRPLYADQPVSSDSSWGITAIGADKSPFNGEGIVVAVPDTGIDRSHRAFSGVDIVERDFTGTGNGDRHGHGTHCYQAPEKVLGAWCGNRRGSWPTDREISDSSAHRV
jgi:subtilisin family serine protease